MLKFVNSAYNAYLGSDSSLVEINPLIQNSSNNILAVDCKFVIDDNSIYRNNEIGLMRDKSEENQDELEAAIFFLPFYFKLFIKTSRNPIWPRQSRTIQTSF